MAGLNQIKDMEATKSLLQKIDETWNTELVKLLLEKTPEQVLARKVPKINLHDEVKEKLLEFGKIEGYIAEKNTLSQI